MGKKSRRQRTKKVQIDAPPAAIKPLGNLSHEQLRGLGPSLGNELLDSQKYWTQNDERAPCRLIDDGPAHGRGSRGGVPGRHRGHTTKKRRSVGSLQRPAMRAGNRGFNGSSYTRRRRPEQLERVFKETRNASSESSDDNKDLQTLAPHPKILAAHPAAHLLGVRKAI
jgi:hypothetical protein